MGTVQAYIQGLEQGSINKNCTFIPITAYPISTTGPNPDGSFNYTRIITYQALDGTTYTIKITYQAFLSMKPPKIIVKEWKTLNNTVVELFYGVISCSIDLICWIGTHVFMISVFGKISVIGSVAAIIYDAAKGEWFGVALDVLSLGLGFGVNFNFWNTVCLTLGISSMNAIYLMAFCGALAAAIPAGLLTYYLLKIAGLSEQEAVIGGLVVGGLVFIIILILVL
jgi:hypothetical protein